MTIPSSSPIGRSIGVRHASPASSPSPQPSIRDAALNDAIGKSLAAGPAAWSRLASLRRDPHEPDASCWLHGKDACLSTHAI